MKVLEIDTAKSLYKPIEVKIDGVAFRVKELTLDSLESIQAMKGDVDAGSVAAIRRMMSMALEGPLEMLGKLSIAKVMEIMDFVVTKAVVTEPDEKNEPAPAPSRSH